MLEQRTRIAVLGSSAITLVLAGCGRGGSNDAPLAVGDAAVISSHLSQTAIEQQQVSLDELLTAGRALFTANFNELDGGGRPETTGTGSARARREFPENFNRISGPDSNSCAGCHNKPLVGGGGDNVANVFVLGQRFPFVNFDGGAGDDAQTHFLDDVANERNTLGMFGSGFIELLAREITTDLQAIRADAVAQAAIAGAPVTLPLSSKGIAFGTITSAANGTIDTSGVLGLDTDLVARPFHQKGVVVSLREFTNNAMNHHHGIQSAERFGLGEDDDNDGVVDELTAGDVTAATLWQATLPAPGRVLPNSGAAIAAANHGEQLFTTLGCAVCHVPDLVLENPVFTEPNPYNPAGNLRTTDVGVEVSVDLTSEGPGPHLAPEFDGSVVVHAYTDFKRHDMGPVCDNEALVQGGVPTEFFLTRKLWGTSNEPPYMHHGRALTLSEAILMHGGEAETPRDDFAALSTDDQNDVVEFLKTLQVLPQDATSNEILGPASGVIGDEPAVLAHVDQDDVDAGAYSADGLFNLGKVLFDASFNTLDGAGRPETTGTGNPRPARSLPENFNRISGPDANSCAGCHNMPRSGGGGDNVANVFVLGQAFPFVNFDASSAGDNNQSHFLDTVANERNTLGMFGSGFIELLAREMTTELQTLRDDASTTAQGSGNPVTVDLVTKGVSFGSLIANANGTFDTTGVEGVNTDLVVRPFHQKGVVVSLREFTNNAMNHHHGIQTAERFGDGDDDDNDGVTNELTVGDVTAATVYQAMLAVPGRVLPANARKRASVDRGEELFTTVGCAVCHVPTLRLESPTFSEPNPFNPAGNLRVADVPQAFTLDLTTAGAGPHLSRETDGAVLVPAYTDLKRHDMGAELDNEALVQGGVPTNQFITKKLWGFASEPPYLHNGRALTIDDAIRKHGGDAATSRDAYLALSEARRKSIVDFLKTLQTLPENSPIEVTQD
ncbi:MAG: hypothetical protein HZA53_11450 [Planctomycetes bacterium]|nr:hypothetical protein [Planctomycetota bacterium]